MTQQTDREMKTLNTNLKSAMRDFFLKEIRRLIWNQQPQKRYENYVKNGTVGDWQLLNNFVKIIFLSVN